MTEELFAQLRTLQDVWDYVWSGYAVTIDTRRRTFDLLDPRRFERGLAQLRAGGRRVVETTEWRSSRAGDLELHVVHGRRWTPFL